MIDLIFKGHEPFFDCFNNRYCIESDGRVNRECEFKFRRNEHVRKNN